MVCAVYKYDFAEEGYWRSILSLDAEEKGWTQKQVAFFAETPDERSPDAIPIHAYHADNPYRDRYSAKPISEKGWHDDGVKFYLPKPGDGMVPVYEYVAVDPKVPERYQYTTEKDLRSGWSRGPVAFHAIPRDVDWTFNYDHFSYDKVEKPETNREASGEVVVINKEGTTVPTVEVEKKIIKSETVGWELSKQLTTGAKVGFEIDLPYAGASGELNVEVQVGSHEMFMQQVTQEFLVRGTVPVAPGESRIVYLYVDWAENVNVPFTLRLRVMGKVGDVALPSATLCGVFLAANPEIKQEDIKHVGDYDLIVELRGSFSGSFGLHAGWDIVPVDDPTLGHQEQVSA